MEMFYCEGNAIIQYSLKTDPPEALYWSTYRLKKSHIVIHNRMDRSEKAAWRTKILKSITYDETVSRSDKSTGHSSKVELG
jgi:hypothetical protein